MPKAVGADMHDLPFFNAHKISPDTTLHINPPAEGCGSLVGKKVLRFTRRINNADGSFAGVILVSKETEYLNRLNEIDELQEGDSIYLEFDNGAELAGKSNSLKELARPDANFSVFSQKKMARNFKLRPCLPTTSRVWWRGCFECFTNRNG